MAEPATTTPRIDDPRFRRAVELIDAGDAGVLREYLHQHPDLLTARAEEPGEFAGAYFASPYLLWFTAENPIRNGRLPANIAEVIQTIIGAARVAAVDGLQEQIDYTLGLVASGCVPRECGLQRAMIDALVGEGASPDAAIEAALGHQEMDAVAALLEHGAEVSLSVAASLGELERIGELFPDAATEDRQRALALAALRGQPEVAAWLISHGVDPNQFNPPGSHAHATPLHNAISTGHADVVRVLLDCGADPAIRDKIYGGGAKGWANHFGRAEILQLLEEYERR